jgi:hypothetical protein
VTLDEIVTLTVDEMELVTEIVLGSKETLVVVKSIVFVRVSVSVIDTPCVEILEVVTTKVLIPVEPVTDVVIVTGDAVVVTLWVTVILLVSVVAEVTVTLADPERTVTLTFVVERIVESPLLTVIVEVLVEVIVLSTVVMMVAVGTELKLVTRDPVGIPSNDSQ